MLLDIYLYFHTGHENRDEGACLVAGSVCLAFGVYRLGYFGDFWNGNVLIGLLCAAIWVDMGISISLATLLCVVLCSCV